VLLTPRQIYDRLCRKETIYAVSIFDLLNRDSEVTVIDSSNIEEVEYFQHLDCCDIELMGSGGSFHFYNFKESLQDNVEVGFSKRKEAQYFVKLLKKLLVPLMHETYSHDETDENEQTYENLRKTKIKKAIFQYCSRHH